MAADEVNEDGGKKGLPTIVIIIAVALLVGAGGFFAGKMMSGGGEAPAEEKPKAQAEQQPAAEENTQPAAEETPPPAEDTESAAAADGTGEGQPPAITGNPLGEGLLVLDEFTVNLNDPFGRRFGKFNMKLVIKPKKHIPKLKADELLMSKVRDEIIMIISAKSYNELKGTSGRITLKEEIIMRINEKIADKMSFEPVTDVLFAEFLIQ